MQGSDAAQTAALRNSRCAAQQPLCQNIAPTSYACSPAMHTSSHWQPVPVRCRSRWGHPQCTAASSWAAGKARHQCTPGSQTGAPSAAPSAAASCRPASLAGCCACQAGAAPQAPSAAAASQQPAVCLAQGPAAAGRRQAALAARRTPPGKPPTKQPLRWSLSPFQSIQRPTEGCAHAPLASPGSAAASACAAARMRRGSAHPQS